MIAYIDMFRDRFGVEPICRVLGATERGFITSRGYRAAETRPASQRAQRDAALVPVVKELHRANYGVYGVLRCGMSWLVLGGMWAVTKSAD